MENCPEGQFSAEKPVCFPETDWAIPALFGRVLWAGWVLTGPDFQVGSVSPVSDLAMLVCLGRALSAGWVLAGLDFQVGPVSLVLGLALLVCLGRALLAGRVLAGPDFQVGSVSPVSGLAVLACLDRALSAGWVLADPDFQVGPVSPVLGLAMLVCLGRALSAGWVLADPDFRVGRVFPVLGLAALASSDRVLPAGLVCRVWPELVLDGGHRVDLPDDLPRAGFPEDLADYNAGDDSPNCHDNLAGWPTQSGADDTQGVADDKDSTILPNSHGCNKRAALPSSIPIRPIPTAGYQPGAPQFRSPH
jgi:hypothetical protein